MEVKLRALIVDDEPLAARRIAWLLKGFPEVQIVGFAYTGADALAIVEGARPNLLFLDIEMPGLSGFDMLERLSPEHSPAVIFSTAFADYAARAFAVSATDFLVKPTTSQDLGRALSRAQRIIAAHKAELMLKQLHENVVELRARLRQAEIADRDIWVRYMGEMTRVRLSTVDWFEAERDYVRIHTVGRSYLLYGMIGALQQKLDSRFHRVHRSAIVRLAAIESLRRGRDGSTTIMLTSGTTVRVGRKYSSALKAIVDAAAGTKNLSDYELAERIRWA